MRNRNNQLLTVECFAGPLGTIGSWIVRGGKLDRRGILSPVAWWAWESHDGVRATAREAVRSGYRSHGTGPRYCDRALPSADRAGNSLSRAGPERNDVEFAVGGARQRARQAQRRRAAQLAARCRAIGVDGCAERLAAIAVVASRAGDPVVLRSGKAVACDHRPLHGAGNVAVHHTPLREDAARYRVARAEPHDARIPSGRGVKKASAVAIRR